MNVGLKRTIRKASCLTSKWAEITADAVPGIQYTGTVERISDATGSAFSLIPIDNATGNFVKVEQRVTVRIKLNENADVARLKSGYNVECIIEE